MVEIAKREELGDGDFLVIEQYGSIIVFDTGHTVRVGESRDEITVLMKSAGLEKNEWIYLSPWWMIDDDDQVAVKVDRVVAVRSLRECKVVQEGE